MTRIFSRGFAIAGTALTIALLSIGITVVNAQKKKPCGADCGDGCTKAKSGQKSTMTNANTSAKPVVCTLTSAEMRERKATIIAELKRKLIERRELPNGYAYKFSSDDESLDRLVSFIKTERQCCGFFSFGLSITDDYATLELTGPEGVKEFVDSEIGM